MLFWGTVNSTYAEESWNVCNLENECCIQKNHNFHEIEKLLRLGIPLE